MQIHNLKTIQPHFDDVKNGIKTFEVRVNDRNFLVGDILNLQLYEKKTLTGSYILADVKHILKGGDFGIDEKYCVMSIVVFRQYDNSDLPF